MGEEATAEGKGTCQQSSWGATQPSPAADFFWSKKEEWTERSKKKKKNSTKNGEKRSRSLDLIFPFYPPGKKKKKRMCGEQNENSSIFLDQCPPAIPRNQLITKETQKCKVCVDRKKELESPNSYAQLAQHLDNRSLEGKGFRNVGLVDGKDDEREPGPVGRSPLGESSAGAVCPSARMPLGLPPELRPPDPPNKRESQAIGRKARC